MALILCVPICRPLSLAERSQEISALDFVSYLQYGRSLTILEPWLELFPLSILEEKKQTKLDQDKPKQKIQDSTRLINSLKSFPEQRHETSGPVAVPLRMGFSAPPSPPFSPVLVTVSFSSLPPFHFFPHFLSRFLKTEFSQVT